MRHMERVNAITFSDSFTWYHVVARAAQGMQLINRYFTLNTNPAKHRDMLMIKITIHRRNAQESKEDENIMCNLFTEILSTSRIPHNAESNRHSQLHRNIQLSSML